MDQEGYIKFIIKAVIIFIIICFIPIVPNDSPITCGDDQINSCDNASAYTSIFQNLMK